MTWRDHAVEHLKADCSKESCGLVVIIKGRERYWPCKNLSADKEQFVLDPLDWAAAEDAGEIMAVVHSHPFSSVQPSQADLISCEKSQLPWHIYAPHADQWHEFKPSGYKAPLIGRKWVWAISDCWTLVRDWYQEEWQLELPDWERPVSFAEFEAAPMFDGCWESAGFVEVELKDMQPGDALLMALENSKLNHCAIYLGDQLILHHVRGRLSSRDLYGGYYLKSTGRVLRHGSRLD